MYIILKGLQVVLLSTHHTICTLTDLLVCAQNIFAKTHCVIDAVELHGTLVLAVAVVLHVH